MLLFLSLSVTAKTEVQKHADLYFSTVLADSYNPEVVELSSAKTSGNYTSQKNQQHSKTIR